MSRSEAERAVGITIGNAQARVAIWESGRAVLVPLEEGERSMPSAVLLHRMREVGKYAYLYSGTDPNLLVTSINRLLGRSYGELTDELKSLSFEARNERNCLRIVDWLGGIYSPIELYAMILRKLRQATERYTNRAVECAVIAVPGSFDDYQRRSVRKAAESVFREVKLINEPTAALLAMAERENFGRDYRLMTFDMGAGKCEVSIIRCRKDHHLNIEAIAGDTHLGGDDIDRLIFDHLAKQFHSSTDETMIGESAMARHEVLMAVREAKHQLETAESANIAVPFVNFDRYGRPLHLAATITGNLVAELSQDLLDRAARLINKCLQDTGHPKLEKILLLGGSTRLPFISQKVFQATRTALMRAHNPDELAALGACLYSEQLAGNRHGYEIEDITAHSLGITTWGGSMGFILKRQSTVPSLITKRFVTVEKDQREVHIEVREGEEQTARDNRVIGEFWLPLPPRLPERSPIDVTIGKDEDGLVRVRAHDLAAHTTREITITYDL